MATEKERKLIREITDLALDVNLAQDEYTIATAYIGHIHAFELRILDGDLIVQNDSVDWAHLSCKDFVWTEAQSVEQLSAMLYTVKTYHPQYDADGVEL